MDVKRCSRCKEYKHIDDFNFNRAMKDGLTNQCRECNKLSQMESRQKAKSKKVIIPIDNLVVEEWRWVVRDGIKFEYKISNYGRIISYKYDQPELMNPCKEPSKLDRNGYINASLRYPCRSRYYAIRVHRLVALAFIPNPQNLPQINHIDGDKSNNVVSNLEWCDAKHNIRHSFLTGLHITPKGDKNHRFDNGRKVKLNGIIYNSVAQAARDNKIPRTTLSAELIGNRPSKYGIEYVD